MREESAVQQHLLTMIEAAQREGRSEAEIVSLMERHAPGGDEAARPELDRAA